MAGRLSGIAAAASARHDGGGGGAGDAHDDSRQCAVPAAEPASRAAVLNQGQAKLGRPARVDRHGRVASASARAFGSRRTRTAHRAGGGGWRRIRCEVWAGGPALADPFARRDRQRHSTRIDAARPLRWSHQRRARRQDRQCYSPVREKRGIVAQRRGERGHTQDDHTIAVGREADADRRHAACGSEFLRRRASLRAPPFPIRARRLLGPTRARRRRAAIRNRHRRSKCEPCSRRLPISDTAR